MIMISGQICIPPCNSAGIQGRYSSSFLFASDFQTENVVIKHLKLDAEGASALSFLKFEKLSVKIRGGTDTAPGRPREL